MTLLDLAFCSYIYDKMSNQDRDYNEFLKDTSRFLDLKNARHRELLFKWLNDWGCRLNNKKREHFLEKIAEWFGKHGDSLPSGTLPDLCDEKLDSVNEIYSTLLKVKGFGHTTVSKILFAIRPEIFPPWDGKIRESLWKGVFIDGTYRSFVLYVKKMLVDLENQCKEKGFKLFELPSKVGRSTSTVVKLIDEYHWITITQRIKPPDKEILRLWFAWQ